MLAKAHRLSRPEFSKVFAYPQKRLHFPLYSLYQVQSPDFKASVVVGKKVAKLAVQRNHLRRRVYAALQQYFRTTPKQSGTWIIIIKPPFATLTHAERQTAITHLLAQIANSR